MGNKESVMAQADIDIQESAPGEDAGRRCGRAFLLTGNLQIFEILSKQTGKMESSCDPDSLGFGRRNILER